MILCLLSLKGNDIYNVISKGGKVYDYYDDKNAIEDA
jgi:hypothetical protein